MKRRQFNKALAVAGALAAVSPFEIVRAQAQKLKVGVILPRSGYLGFIGQSCQKGADLAPGVIKEMLGVDIELMNADFESNVATAPQITEQGYKFVFRNFQTAGDIVRNGLDLIGELFQATSTVPRTAVYMHVNDTFGQAMSKGIHAMLPVRTQLPFKIVDDIGYDPAAKDLAVEVSKAKAANADFLLLVCRLNDAIILRREMVKQRWQPMGIVSPGSPGMYEEQYFKTLGKLSEYSISNVPWYNPNAKLTKVVERAFKKANPNDNLVFHGLNAGFTFEAILIAADAFKRAKSTDPKTLADAIRQTYITEKMTLGGPIKFNAKGQVEGIGSACVQNLNLLPTVVLPKEAATATPVFPVPSYKKA